MDSAPFGWGTNAIWPWKERKLHRLVDENAGLYRNRRAVARRKKKLFSTVVNVVSRDNPTKLIFAHVGKSSAHIGGFLSSVGRNAHNWLEHAECPAKMRMSQASGCPNAVRREPRSGRARGAWLV